MSIDIMPAEVATAESQRLARAAAWDKELAERATPAPLHQSWAWGEVQRGIGWPPERVRLPDGSRAQVLIRGLKPFELGFAPRGPVPASIGAIRELVRWARERGLVMLRVEPEGPVELAAELSAEGFRHGPSMEAQRTTIVELCDSESMLGSFRSSTRRNIRIAERSDVVVEEVRDPTELSRQVRITADRQRVYITGAAFHRTVVDRLPRTRLYVARHGAEVLAAILVAHHDRRAYYLVGGSSGLRRETMPNYALHWRAIHDARAAGCVDYDLCGLPVRDEEDDPSWSLRQFKTGFGGAIVEYPGAWELVLRPTQYWMLRRVHRVRLRGTRLVAKARNLAARRS